MAADSPLPADLPADVPPVPAGQPSGTSRLLTIAEAASASGLSRKALARRVERGTLSHVKEDPGNPKSARLIPRGELVRAGLLNEDGTPGSEGRPGGELVRWQDLYERERVERQAAEQRASALERDLLAIANAGPLRAVRLRRAIRAKLSEPPAS